jgi:hypothetical protein
VLGIAVLPAAPLADAFCRKVLRSLSSEATLMLARIWVVDAPATV